MPALQDDSPAVAETRLVHQVHRRATSLLADVFSRPSGALDEAAQLRDFVVATLDHHHRSEDTGLWPLLLAAAPNLAGPLAALSDEHERLDAELDALRAAPVGAIACHTAAVRAAAVRDLVHEHLAHEEPVLFPALREHVSDEAWAEFSARTVATAPPEGIDLMVALLYEVGAEADVELIFRHLPPAGRDQLPSKRAHGLEVLSRLDPQLTGDVPSTSYTPMLVSAAGRRLR